MQFNQEEIIEILDQDKSPEWRDLRQHQYF